MQCSIKIKVESGRAIVQCSIKIKVDSRRAIAAECHRCTLTQYLDLSATVVKALLVVT